MGYYDQYTDLFKTEFDFKGNEIKTHLKRLKLLDKILPPSSTFIMITNTQNGTYEFISKNFEYATGLPRQVFEEKGIPFFLSLIHKDEIQNWLQIIKELMNYYLLNYKKEELNKLEFQYNYRIQIKNDQYINILENQVNLVSDENGKPIIGLGHFVVYGDGYPEPMKAVIRSLNVNNEYETIFRKAYGSKLIEQGLTNRERDVLRLIALGFENQQISDKLFISVHTVRTHRKNMLEKCNVNNISELLVKCIKEGII